MLEMARGKYVKMNIYVFLYLFFGLVFYGAKNILEFIQDKIFKNISLI